MPEGNKDMLQQLSVLTATVFGKKIISSLEAHDNFTALEANDDYAFRYSDITKLFKEATKEAVQMLMGIDPEAEDKPQT